MAAERHTVKAPEQAGGALWQMKAVFLAQTTTSCIFNSMSYNLPNIKERWDISKNRRNIIKEVNFLPKKEKCPSYFNKPTGS